MWDAEIGQPLGRPLDIAPNDEFLLIGAAFSPDGKTIRSCNYGGTSRAWDAANGQAVGRALRHPGCVLAVAFSPDGKAILTAGEDNIGRLWDAATGRVVGRPLPLGSDDLALSPDGVTALAGDRLWDMTTGQPIGEPLGHGGIIWGVQSGWKDRPDRESRGTARRLGTPRPVNPSVIRSRIETRSGPSHSARMAGSSAPVARTRRRACGTRLPATIGGPLEHLDGLLRALSPDGRLVLTGSADRTARLWDAATGQPIGPPMEHRAEVIAVAFSPDGKTILTASPHSATTSEDDGAALWLWQTPSPFHDDPPRIAAWVEAATGLELDRQGSVRSLDNAAWRQRLDQLHRWGGPPATDRSRRLDPILFGPDPAARADGLMNLGRRAEAEAAYAEAIRVRPYNKSV